MRILVLGGSPKGETSVTWQYVRWLRENLVGHDLECIQIASRIQLLEKDEAAFAAVIGAVRRADALIWAFPLYVFTVCSQYKRFIELLGERGVEAAFAAHSGCLDDMVWAGGRRLLRLGGDHGQRGESRARQQYRAHGISP